MVEKMKNVDNVLRISIVIILLVTILACGIGDCKISKNGGEK